jgi:hypothetical protein
MFEIVGRPDVQPIAEEAGQRLRNALERLKTTA